MSDAVVAERLGLSVTGLGMVTPLGLDAVTSCAAARAGISRAAPLPGFKLYDEDAWDEVGVTGHALHLFAKGFEGFGRLVRLGQGALDDLLRTSPLTPEQAARTALCVATGSAFFQAERARQPGASNEQTQADRGQLTLVREQLLPRLRAHTRLPLPPAQCHLVADDQCGFVLALFKARELLASGQVDRVIVGGVDACTDGSFMAAAHQFQALKSEAQPAGFQPGEAAAFLLIETAAVAQARGAAVLAQLDAASWVRDAVKRTTSQPAVGVGLSQALRVSLGLTGWPQAAPDWLLGDLNGDVFRGNDWGYALVRLKIEHPTLGEVPQVLPAEHFGELGAATGPVAVGMALRAQARRHAPGQKALVWLSAYNGSRAALALQLHTKEHRA
jgi:3-oxoacyl-(acyl-carrier-protein) synthase